MNLSALGSVGRPDRNSLRNPRSHRLEARSPRTEDLDGERFDIAQGAVRSMFLLPLPDQRDQRRSVVALADCVLWLGGDSARHLRGEIVVRSEMSDQALARCGIADPNEHAAGSPLTRSVGSTPPLIPLSSEPHGKSRS